MHKQNSNSRVTIDEATIKIGETKEGLDVFDVPWFGPILNDLDLV